MEHQRHQRQGRRFLQEVIEGPPCEFCAGDGCKDCIGMVCEYCNLSGHSIKHCHLITFHNLHGICTYCRVKGHRRLQCPIAPQVPMPAQNNALHVHGRTVQLQQEKQAKVSDSLARLEQDTYNAFVGFTEIVNMEQHSAVGPQGNYCLKEEVQPQELSHVAFVGFTEILNFEQHGAVGPKKINVNAYHDLGLVEDSLIQRSDSAYIIQKCDLKEVSIEEEGFEEMQDCFDMPEIHFPCFEEPWDSKCQKGVNHTSMPQAHTEDYAQVNKPAPKEWDKDDEVIFDIANIFEESVHEREGISQTSACHIRPMFTANNDTVSPTATPSVHQHSAVPKALLPTTANTNFSAHNLHVDQAFYSLLPVISKDHWRTKTISYDHTLYCLNHYVLLKQVLSLLLLRRILLPSYTVPVQIIILSNPFSVFSHVKHCLLLL